MGKVKIKDKDKLIKILKTISWLDERRWSEENQREFINFFRDDLTNCEKILTHWIGYVTDRQMPFEMVWEKGGYVFSEIVHEYKNSNRSPEEILGEHYEKYKKRGETHFRFKSTDGKTFAPRYVNEDYESILQTLKVLDMYEVSVNGNKYKRDIVAFILHFIQKFEGKEDLLRRVACALHLLTYQLDRRKANPDRVVEILEDDEKFERNLREFKRNATTGKKRLWCSIRDYKKGLYHKRFNNAIKEVVSDDNYADKLIDTWDKLPMDQIELPGDVWNNNPVFREKLFAKVLDFSDIERDDGTLKWGMSKVIRDIYNQLKNDEEVKKLNFYPERFDVTFDFVPRMCNKGLCDICLFGKNSVESVCIPTEDKYCPVVLLSCGYIAKCDQNCMIRKGISKWICEGRG